VANYAQLSTTDTQQLLKDIFSLVSKRPDSACNFLDTTGLPGWEREDVRVVYRVRS
jgi:AP-3 complex subunit sigma